MKKIVFVNPTGDIDIRLYKFLKYFQNSTEVYLISPEYLKIGHKKLFEDLNYEKINKIDINPNYNANFPFDFKRYREIRKKILEINPDVIICRDIMISGFLNKSLSRKISSDFILDVCDSFPEVMKVMLGTKGKFLSLIANHIEKKAIKSFNKILFVSPEARDFILGKHKLKKESCILENVPYEMNKQNRDFKFNNNKLVYLGTINENIRDLDTVFKGIEILKNSYNQNLELDVFYFENQLKIKEKYEKMAKKMNLNNLITFKKAIPNKDLDETLKNYSIGLVPHCRNNATDYTIPNKIYDYINSGIYILASDNPSLERLLKSWEVGKVYKGGIPESFAKVIMEIKNEVEIDTVDVHKINNELNWKKQLEGIKL